ncbi:GGDEF domain-containing protein [Rhizobium sp. Rhizsp82]|uniref:GGDEF domain-containing protein n=1 Tax=Rhizobium sp. Rhizsp82 TaxID=3243057 RepID=UPI0039B3F85F
MDDTDLLPPDVLSSMLMRMFEFAPIAMAITTSDTKTSSYAKVNDAYLKLTGLKWEDISGKKLTSEGAAIDNPARDRRHRMLAEDGAYVLEEVDIRHADGTIIPTLISAQRTIVGGVSFDVEVIMDVSARVRHQREIELALRASARTDALSGLPNRACFDETLAEQIETARAAEKSMALAFIDLNGFKAVNDRLGHGAGDEVIRTLASRFRESFRANDFIARIGGDEFVVLIEVDPVLIHDVRNTVTDAAERIFKPIAIDGAITEVGAAVGVALLEPADTAASFVKRADNYMYLAKQTGERVAVIWLGNPDAQQTSAGRAVG